MRITKDELDYSDITWYAADKNGKIIEFTSAGSGNIPEFVCADKERVELLEKYFANVRAQHSGSSDDERVYCFDACDGTNRVTYYLKESSPKKPLLVSELPEEISRLLSQNYLDIDVETVEKISVEHAYDTFVSVEHFVPLIISGKLAVLSGTEYYTVDFSTKHRYKKIVRLFRESGASFQEIQTVYESSEQTETTKSYYEIMANGKKYLLYLVYKSDRIVCGKGGLYSVQISRMNENAVLDFNDKTGVWVEV